MRVPVPEALALLIDSCSTAGILVRVMRRALPARTGRILHDQVKSIRPSDSHAG